MSHQTFTISDPRTFDGTPYEVAQRSVAQALALAELLSESLDIAYVMARNAELSRNLHADESDARAKDWPDTAQAKKLDDVRDHMHRIVTALPPLERAAGYDPRTR